MEVEHQNLYGGSGIVKISVIDAQVVAPFVSVLLYKLQPNASIGLHQHQVDSTLLIGTSGFGIVEVNGLKKCTQSNDVLMIPCKAQVSISNSSSDEEFAFWLVRGRT